MKPIFSRFRHASRTVPPAVAIFCVVLLAREISVAQTLPLGVTIPAASNEEEPRISDAQLDSLVAPIALYPDSLLSQTLVAATYPLELIQLQQWLDQNKGLSDKALANAVAKQPWDPSIQSMAGFPEVVKKLSGNIQWTSDLGNAFLAQQSDTMAAVQRMRAKAHGTGNLKTNPQQQVTTQMVNGGTEVIVIQQASPNVVYVPTYDPVVVYGAPAYPYPPLYYPGYVPGTGLAFGAGLALGAACGGGWGYGCGWGHGDVNVNVNNSYVKNSNRSVNQSNNWSHNPQHRGNAPYGNRQTANQYGGAARGQAKRSSGAGAGVGAGAGNRPSGGAGVGAGAGNRPSGGAGVGAGNRPSGGASPRPTQGGGANSIGGRSPSAGGGSAFGGGGASSRSSAAAASSRGSRSMSGGGGGGRSGGGRSGGGRGR